MTTELKTRLDYDDLAHTPDDGKQYELLDGVLYVTPAPSPFHQRASKRLQRQLERYFEDRGLAEVFNAPLDVILTHHDVVEPDVLVVREPAQVSNRGIEGAPLIAVEVLSPSTMKRDRTIKSERYAATGLAHYWIVDIEARRLECFRLNAAGRYELVIIGSDAPFRHPDFPELEIDPTALWIPGIGQ